MNCDEFQQLLDKFDDLSENDKLIMEIHSSECDKCHDDMEFMYSIMNTVRTLPKITPPDDFINTLNKRIDLENIKERQQKRLSWKHSWKKYGSVAACLLLVAVVGVNGKTLISNMNNSGNGVISEERQLSDNDNNLPAKTETTDTVGDGNAVTDSGENKSNNTVNQEASKSLPASSNSVSQGINQNVETVKPQTKLTPNNTKNSTQSSTASVSTPSPTIKTYSAPPIESTEPETKENYNASLTRENDNVVIDKDISEQESQPYTLEKDNYKVPNDNKKRNTSNDSSSEKSTLDGYTLESDNSELALGMYTPIDKEGNPTDYYEQPKAVKAVPAGSSILVSSEDEAKVKELVSKYIVGNSGEYYMTTMNKLDNLFEEMDKEGISYKKFVKSSTERVSFTIVTS